MSALLLPGRRDPFAEFDAGVLTVRVAGAYAGTGPARVPVRAVAATRQEAITQGEEKPAA